MATKVRTCSDDQGSGNPVKISISFQSHLGLFVARTDALNALAYLLLCLLLLLPNYLVFNSGKLTKILSLRFSHKAKGSADDNFCCDKTEICNINILVKKNQIKFKGF